MSARVTECVLRHQRPNHFMERFSMISQKFVGKEQGRVDQGFEYHNTTGWSDIVNVGLHKRH